MRRFKVLEPPTTGSSIGPEQRAFKRQLNSHLPVIVALFGQSVLSRSLNACINIFLIIVKDVPNHLYKATHKF